MQPEVAVPMHYGFLCGNAEDAERFRDEASPVKVEIMRAQQEFEHDQPAHPGGGAG
jgi:L-ascorbate metabolism protein UlaG (beta-lactamase superfamily)